MNDVFDFPLFAKVKMPLDSLMDSLVSLSDIGDCVARVEHLLKELKSIEEKAQVGPHFTYLMITKSLGHQDFENSKIILMTICFL